MNELLQGLDPDLFPEINDETKTILEFQDGKIEIAPGMTVEEIKPQFALIQSPYQIWQLNSSGHRYYYRYNDQGNPEFFPSVTTILSQTMPKSKYLFDWILEKGIDEAERYRDERAEYGTFMHGEFAKLIISRTYDFDELKKSLKKYIEQKRLPDNFIFYADDLKKDVLAFAQFVIDYDVRPMAVEIALVHPFHNYAGMIDLPCSMLEKIGGKTRINAIVDFKSGRKGFYEEAEIQLHMYRDMWNVNFPDNQIDKVFNFSPKDWRKRPSYNLKDQTGSVNAKKIPGILHIAAIEDGKKDNTFTSISGIIDLDRNKRLTDNVVSLTLSELVKSKPVKAPEKETPETETEIPETEPEKTETKTPDKPQRKTTRNKAVKEAETKKGGAKRTNTRSSGKSPANRRKTSGDSKKDVRDLLNDNSEF